MADTDSTPTKPPAFQFYPNDFLSDSNVIVMSLQERGAYITLICFCWLDGSIPSDMARLARLCHCSRTVFERLWPALKCCFRTADGGRFIHPRVERERRKQEEYREQQAAAGRRGAGKRWLKPKHGNPNGEPIATPLAEDSKPIVSPMAKNSSSSSSSSSDFSQRESTPTKVTHDGPRLRVWHWQHEDLGKRLGGKVDSFDLLGWYSRLEHELARTGESFADPWKWLQERLYRDAKLSLPNLMGKTQESRRSVPSVEATKAYLQRMRQVDG